MKKVIKEHWLVIAVLVYLILTTVGAVRIYRKAPKGNSMDWAEVQDNVDVKAKPDGIWTLAYDYVKGPALIQIEAHDDEWQYAPGKKCKADGDLSSMLCSREAILPSAPVGAMIAKVGGSTAGLSDGRMFVVGKRCLLQLDQSTSGPLYLTINDELSGMQNNDGVIKVKISIKPIAATAPNTSPVPGSPIIAPVTPVPAPTPPTPAGAPIPAK